MKLDQDNDILLLKGAPVMREGEDGRDEMGREPIRKLQPQYLAPQVAVVVIT